MGSISQFCTSEAAEEGVKFDLDDLDGNPSGEWMIIKGADSETFRVAQLEYIRASSNIETEDKAEKSKLQSALVCKFAGSLVVDWSFDEPCDPKTIAETLKIAPALSEQIQAAATERSKFVKKKSVS